MAGLGAVVLVVAIGLVIPDDPGDEPGPVPDSSGLTPAGIGSLDFGYEGWWHFEEYFEGDFAITPQDDVCSLAVSRDASLPIAITATSGGTALTLIVGTPDITTAEGVGVGDTLDDVIDTYGEDSIWVMEDIRSRSGGPIYAIDESRSAGEEWVGDESLLYAVETDADGTVTMLRAGLFPWVTYVDHCSNAEDRPDQTGWPLTE